LVQKITFQYVGSVMSLNFPKNNLINNLIFVNIHNI